jgi:hypothetical protein
MCKTCVFLTAAIIVLAVLPIAPLRVGEGSALGAEDPSLVGWWKLDEGDGDVAIDSSGRGVNGTIFNLEGGMGPDGSAWVQDPERGMVLSFSGDDVGGAYVEAGTIPAMTLTNSFTWTVWCKQDQAGTGVNETMLGNRYGGTEAPLQFIKFTPTKFEYYNDDTAYSTSITYPQPMPDGVWVHNAAVKDGTTLTYYRNGKKVASSTVTKTMDANPFYMGGDPVGERWRGALSDVRLYERAVTEAEIKQIAWRPKARQPDPADGAMAVAMPLFRWTPGDDAVLHDVYIGTTPELGPQQLVWQRYAVTTFYYTVPLQPATTYFWRIDEIEGDGVTTHTGDVWTFMTQDLTAYYPSPADGANDAAPDPDLTWLPGQNAVKHHVYFSDSLDAVTQSAADADKGERALADANFAPGTLESLKTYHWRVDEVLFGGVIKAGAVWSFTTYLPVEDFESYNDDEGTNTRIYETWLDGWVNNNGATVGYTEPPFAEQMIVHGGLQSMPLDYNNIPQPFYSEAVREFSPQADWTVDGVDTLVLYVRGRLVNSPARLYVTLEDASQRTGTVAYPDSTVVTTTQWTAWRIPLSDFGSVNVARVKKMYIGLGDPENPVAGGTGRLYIDDICVTRPAEQ